MRPASGRQPLPMWADEQHQPGRYAALYLAAFFGALALSHAFARGWL